LSIDHTRRSIDGTPRRAGCVVSADPTCVFIKDTLKVEAINTWVKQQEKATKYPSIHELSELEPEVA
jgi:hypothetical protein